MIHAPFSQARIHLAKYLAQVTHDREVVIIQRRGEEDGATILALPFVSFVCFVV